MTAFRNVTITEPKSSNGQSQKNREVNKVHIGLGSFASLRMLTIDTPA